MASRLIGVEILPNLSPMDPGRDKEWQNRQMELVKSLETKLRECEQTCAQQKLTLDQYWFQSLKSTEWLKHFESQLNDKDQEKTALEQKLHEVTNQNERLHSILTQMQNLLTKKTDREDSANAEVLRKHHIIEDLKSQIRILRDERNFDNFHVKYKREIRKKNLKIVELESDLRRIRSNKRVIHASLQEHYQLERKLQQKIIAGNQTIENLTFELAVLAAETKRKVKARDEKVLKLELDLQGSKQLCVQLQKKVQNRSIDLKRISEQLTERNEQAAKMNRIFDEQTQELNKYKQDQNSIFELLKNLGNLVETNLPENPEIVEMLTGVIESVEGVQSRLEDLQQSFTSMFEVNEIECISRGTPTDAPSVATLSHNTDSADAKTEDIDNNGSVENEEIRRERQLCLTHYENTSNEHSSTNIPFIDLTMDDLIDVEN